jgi:cellobiose phosphorylase
LRLEVDKLYVTPCIPADWKIYKVAYRFRGTIYNITINQVPINDANLGITVDGIKSDNLFIFLVDDRKEHSVELRVDIPVHAVPQEL